MYRGWSIIKRFKIIFKVVSIWSGLCFTITRVNELREANPILFALNLEALFIKQKMVLFLRGKNDENYVVSLQKIYWYFINLRTLLCVRM